MVIKIGSKGSDVKKIQEKLNIKSDGDFGTGTESAVKKWQLESGLPVTGSLSGDDFFKLTGYKISESVLSLDKLKGSVPDSVISQLSDNAEKMNINSNLRLAHFLSQCAHESGWFKVTSENLNYSSDGLKKIFGRYFPGTLSESYARNPQKIASRVYANRMGNGPENTGDGFKYRGRGFLQTTGKSNYEAFSKFIGEDVVANPDLVSQKYPLAAAAFFFTSNKLWDICDLGSTDEVVKTLTKRINGGFNGLSERVENFHKFNKLLS